MAGPEYATDRRDRIHQVAGFVVWIGLTGLGGIRGGLGGAAETGGAFLLPLFCICFPTAMGAYRGIVFGEGRYIDSPSHPVFLRWAGWFLLAGVPLLLWLIGSGAD